MKKIISVLTAIVVFIAMFSAVPFGNSLLAETAGHLIDFEDEQGTAFYGAADDNTNRITYADNLDIGTAENHGNVMHFSKLMVYRNDGAYNEWNTIYYPTAFRLPTSDGGATLYFVKNTQYTVSFQMKRNAAVETTNFTNITAALVFADSYAVGKDTGNIRDWVNNGQTATLTVVDLKVDSDWVTYTANITVPSSGYGAFMLYGSGYEKAWKASCDIDVDNISIVPTVVSSDIVNFEGNQGTAFYGAGDSGKANRIANADTVDIATAENHGSVMAFSKLMVYRDDTYVTNTSSNAVKWNTIYYPSAFRLPTTDGSNTLYYEKGSKYTVSFQMKKNATVDTTYFTEITAALVFADSYANGDLTGNVRDWVNNGQTVTLTTVGLEADSDWVTYTANITVPVSGYAAFMLYGTNYASKCDIYVDNIKLTPVVTALHTVDFENTQATFYSSSTNRITNTDVVDVAATDDGNVMHFSNLKVYRTDSWVDNTTSESADWNNVKWHTIYYPSAFRLTNSDGSDTLYFEKGTQYTVSFKMRKNQQVSNTYFPEINAAIVFDDSYALGDLTGNVRDWVENNQTAMLAEIDLNADTDWQTYTTVITVPVSGYGAFMLYGTNNKTAYSTDCDIDVDDITFEEFDSASLKRDGDVNRDGDISLVDLVHMKKMASGINLSNESADLDYDRVSASSADLTMLRKILLNTAGAIPYTKGERILVWNEEFGFENTMHSSFNFRKAMSNDEVEDYTVVYENEPNYVLENGELNMSVGKTDTGYSVCETVSTKDMMYFKHGYLEMRAKVPYSFGAWPGFWLLGNTPYHDSTADWFAEIDIFEVFSSENALYWNIHKHGGQNQGVSDQLGVFNKNIDRSFVFENYENLSNEYHIYGFEWTETQMKLYIDDVHYATFNYSDFDTSKYYPGTEYFNDFMYLQITNDIHPNSLVDGTEEITANMSVDWVRLYQNAENGEQIIY